MLTHLNRLLLAALTEQSGSVLTASLNGKPVFKIVSETILAVPSAVRHGSSQNRCSLHLRHASAARFCAAQHQLLSEWDYELNAKEGIHPHNTTLRSGKLVNWICHKCPRGRSHRWRARPLARTIRGVGCPCCASKQVCVCNSLQSLLPKLSSEWDHTKNYITPADVTAQSNKVVWWQNDKRGSWQQAVYERARSVEHKLLT